MPVSTADLFAGIMPFVATAEARSLTGAAQRLGVTPSAVSKAIARLEAELGVRLLNRTARAVTLTEEGTLFYRESRNAVAGVRSAREVVAQRQETPRGTLRVSLPLALGELVIMPALGRLLAQFPGLTIEASLTDRWVDLTAETTDVVVRIGRPVQSGLARRRLPPVRWTTVAAPSYLSRRGTPRRPEDLVEHNCLQFILPRGVPQPWRFQRAAGPPAVIGVQGNLASDHPGGLVQAALAGLGLLQVHRYIVAHAVAEGRLVEVLAADAPPGLPMGVFFPNGQARSPKVRAFVDAMVELLGGLDRP
jgi:DNA-binding transcriptional LysR family regulator